MRERKERRDVCVSENREKEKRVSEWREKKKG